MPKPIRITDAEAIKLVYQRAETEHRSAANAAATTIIEQLSRTDNNGSGHGRQSKNAR